MRLRQSRLFTLSEDHRFVDEAPQISLPTLTAHVPYEEPVEDEDMEDDEITEEGAHVVRIFLGGTVDSEQGPPEDEDDVLAVGAGLFVVDEPTMDTPALLPPPAIHMMPSIMPELPSAPEATQPAAAPKPVAEPLPAPSLPEAVDHPWMHWGLGAVAVLAAAALLIAML